MLEVLLDNQFVHCRFLEKDMVFHAQSGSGMGQIASGDVSQKAFYEMVEARPYTPTKLNKFGIVCYARLRDDILVFAADRPCWSVFSTSTFISNLIAAAKSVYKLKSNPLVGGLLFSWIFKYSRELILTGVGVY